MSGEVRQLKEQYGPNAVPIRKRLTTLMEEALARASVAHLAAAAAGPQLAENRGRPVSS